MAITKDAGSNPAAGINKTMEEKKYKIELDDREAELFLMFRRYQDLWEQLPYLRCRTLQLHIDSSGQIKSAGIIINEKKEKLIFSRLDRKNTDMVK